MKLYVCSDSENGKENIGGIYYLITEEGECLASHLCSCKYFAKVTCTKTDQKELKNIQNVLENVNAYILEKTI